MAACTGHNMASEAGKENIGAAEAQGSLAKMFSDGNSLIQSKRSDNLFQQLESRTLTADEQKIIQDRVDLQRRMLAAYERQEKARKVEDIRNIYKDISEEEAGKALEMCDNSEEEAVARLAEPDFRRRVTATASGSAPPTTAALPAARRQRLPKARRTDAGKAKGVFVGTFRGRGYAPKQEAVSRKASRDDPEREEDAGEIESDPIDEDEPSRAAPGEDSIVEEAAELLDAAEDSVDVGIYGDEEAQATEDEEGEQLRHLLAKETSGGELRPATTSEIAGLNGTGTATERMLPTPPSVTSNKPKDAAEAEGAVSEATLARAANLLARQALGKAAKFLQTMPAHVAERALARLKAQDARRAEILTVELSRRGPPALATVEEDAVAPSEQQDQAAAADHVDAAEEAAEDDEAPRLSRRTRGARIRPAARAAIEALSESEQEEEGSPDLSETEDDDFPEPASKIQRKVVSRPSRAAKAKAMRNLAAEPPSDHSGDEPDHSPCTHATRPLPPNGPARGRRTKRPHPARTQGVEGSAEARKASPAEEAEVSCKAAVAPVEAEPKRECIVVEEKSNDKPSEATNVAATAATGDATDEAAEPAGAAAGAPKGRPSKHAISVRGHTNRGRVRQKSHKSAELVDVGSVRVQPGWYNAGYIFPEGFTSRVNFRSSVELDQLCVHECSVTGRGGRYWPAPTFTVVAMDRPSEPLVAKSCTGCWTAVLKRINAEIDTRRKRGEDLPPPPKTAIAGPEYFGFNQAEMQEAIEALDSEHACKEYWQGKSDREAHAAGLPVDTSARPPRQRSSGAGKARRKRSRESSDEEAGETGDGDDDEAAMMSNKWSAVSRSERYRKRCGRDGDAEYVDADNPLPGWIDPITLEPVATPAISPWGHIMGMATWKAILSSSGKCPFTQRSLSWEQCQPLTKRNIARLKDRIVADDEVLKKFGLR